MADRRIDEVQNTGQTTFGIGEKYGSSFYPFGALGRWFAKFFATKAGPQLAADQEEFGDNETQSVTPHNLAGDAVVRDEVIKAEQPAGWSGGEFSKSQGKVPIFPQQELLRKNRYREYEQMDEYPEISTAFDIYADDSTQRDLKGVLVRVDSENVLIKEEVERFFKTIKMEQHIWDIVRNTTKYGDCFIESIIDVNEPKMGIQKVKMLNPMFIYRVENEYGYLTDFLQEIPNKNDWDAFGMVASEMSNRNFLELDKNQIVHFRLQTADALFYPYGRSIAAGSRTTFRSLKLMEDAMLIYRLQRAPERRVFYLDTGQMPASKAEAFVERVKQKFKKEKYYDTTRETINERYNPLSADEDFFVPVKGKAQGTKIETLPGAQNLGDVDDVKYFRDKLLAALKIPKDYIVEKDKSPERKSNLSQLDVKFARTIKRVQTNIEQGLEELVRRHLLIRGFPPMEVHQTNIKLAEPGDMFLKRKLDIEDQRTMVVSQVQNLGMFSKETIYKEFYEYNDLEIEREKEKLIKEMDDPAFVDPMAGMEEGMGGMGGLGDEGEIGNAQQGGEIASSNSQGLEPSENTPPTANEGVLKGKLRRLDEILDEDTLNLLKS